MTLDDVKEESTWSTQFYRNTAPYNLIEGDEQYQYMPLPNKLKQHIDLKGVAPGVVESIGITTGGKNYKSW